MKRFVAAILCFIMGCVGLVGCTKEPELTPQQTAEKTISYYAVIDDGTEKETTSIPASMYKKDGMYPTKYVVGAGTTISELVEYTNEEYNLKYTFEGWFTDEELKISFEKIDKTAKDDINLYAKIIRTMVETTPAEPEEPTPIFFTIEYQYKLNSESAKTGHFSVLFDTEKTYPECYEEGKALTIPNYKKSKTIQEGTKNIQYTFIAWYIDASCTTAFEGTIPATQTGKVTLYAKITSKDVTKDAWTAYY